MMKKAIVYGASGLVGSFILDLLLQNNSYDCIYAVTRRKLSIVHPKLINIVGELDEIENLTQGILIDEVYISLGTTKKKTPDLKKYYKIDHDYPVLAAQAAKNNGAKSVLLVSSVGANAKASSFYLKTKGETERDIISIQFDHTLIFKPSLIMGKRNESRFLEDMSKKIGHLINPLLSGKLSKFKGIEAKAIATSMIREANQPKNTLKVLHWKEMTK